MSGYNIPLSTLISRVTRDSALADILSAFSGLGFKVTSWQSGGIGRTVAEFLADMVVQLDQYVYNGAAGRLLDLAEGPWLTLLAWSWFREERVAAIKTVGTMVLTSSDGAPVHDIEPNQLWVRDTERGLRYTNTTGDLLASGSEYSIELTFEAELGGQAYNIPVDQPLQLETVLEGVTVTNPDAGSGDWISTPGADEQNDDSLSQLCRDKWATLAAQPTAAAYRYWAMKASDQISRVWVDATNPDGAGSLRVYLAGSTGAITDSSVIAAARAAVLERLAVGASADGAGASGSGEGVLSASNLDITGLVTGDVYWDTSVFASEAAAKAAALAAIEAYLAIVPIGGEQVGATKAVFTAKLGAAIQAVDGIVLARPDNADIEPDADEVAICSTVPTGLLFYEA